jgi:hypothetical protein
LIFIGCASKQPIKSISSTILFKTKNMKFYDSGFVNIYDNYVDMQIFNSGVVALHLKVYKDQVCSSTFKCMGAKQFNQTYLDKSYKDSFLYNLLRKDKIYFKDKKAKVLIKVNKNNI